MGICCSKIKQKGSNNNLNNNNLKNNNLNNNLNNNNIIPYDSNTDKKLEATKNKIYNNNKIDNNAKINKINNKEIIKNNNNKLKKKDTKIKIIGIRFLSTDQKIDYILTCNTANFFTEVEKKLYMQYPQLVDKNIHFAFNGNIIDRNSTIEDNKIKHGSCILIIENDNEEDNEPLDNEERKVLLHFMSSDQKININLNISYKLSDKFIIVVNRLNEEFPYLKERNIVFMANGNVLDITASFQKNKIKNESTILIVEMEKIILLHFISTDQAINRIFDIACISSDKFEIIEKRLYDEFPDLKKKDLFFLTGGYKIKRTATLEENRIEDNSVILICEFVD